MSVDVCPHREWVVLGLSPLRVDGDHRLVYTWSHLVDDGGYE